MQRKYEFSYAHGGYGQSLAVNSNHKNATKERI
jgi:hypothetical protein